MPFKFFFVKFLAPKKKSRIIKVKMAEKHIASTIDNLAANLVADYLFGSKEGWKKHYDVVVDQMTNQVEVFVIHMGEYVNATAFKMMMSKKDTLEDVLEEANQKCLEVSGTICDSLFTDDVKEPSSMKDKLEKYVGHYNNPKSLRSCCNFFVTWSQGPPPPIGIDIRRLQTGFLM